MAVTLFPVVRPTLWETAEAAVCGYFMSIFKDGTPTADGGTVIVTGGYLPSVHVRMRTRRCRCVVS